MKWSVEGKLGLLFFVVLVAGAGVGATLTYMLDSVLLATALAVVICLLPVLYLAKRGARPIRNLLRAMTSVVSSYRDGDFNISLATDRADEIGDLLVAHNELGRALREQRSQLAQRELLLETVAQNSPVALLLVDSHDRVAYSNLAARQFLNDGRNLAGQSFTSLLERAPAALRAVAQAGEDSLFTVEIDGTEESFHLAKQSLSLQGRPHKLYLLKRMTRELSRLEVATWKNLIRVLNHELNNSLAPIASLAHSGATMVRRGQVDELGAIFAAIAERAEHLHQFILDYAKFAKLPTPSREWVEWERLVAEVRSQQSCNIPGMLPPSRGWFDCAQVSQALINLLKNAHEAGGPADQIEIAISQLPGEDRIEVRDRGPGMTETVMSQALLPFYSTKRSGTGLGLALVREIAEAHGGRITLSNREGGGLCAALVLPRMSGTFDE